MTEHSLYKDPINGKISGVCAGLANYLELPIWLVRVLAICAALLGGIFVILITYIALVLLLETPPPEQLYFSSIKRPSYKRGDVWKRGEDATDVLNSIEKELKTLDEQIASMECYTQSDAFRVAQAFRR